MDKQYVIETALFNEQIKHTTVHFTVVLAKARAMLSILVTMDKGPN